MQSHRQLRSLLDQEVENLQSLHTILQREYDALLKADAAAIEQGAALKNQALSIQSHLTENRRRWLSSAPGQATEIRLAEYVQDYGDAGLQALFTRLSDLAEECHTLNRTNGRLIAQRQQQTLGALDILRHTDSTNTTYSLTGKTSPADPTGRTLGKA